MLAIKIVIVRGLTALIILDAPNKRSWFFTFTFAADNVYVIFEFKIIYHIFDVR